MPPTPAPKPMIRSIYMKIHAQAHIASIAYFLELSR